MSTLPKIKLERWDRTKYNLQDFQGKNILVINIHPTVEKFENEIASYKNLKQKYKDDLIIILIPSRDFENTFPNLEGIELDPQIVEDKSFVLNYWTKITGVNKNPLYKWLTLVLEDHYYEDVHPKDVIESREIQQNFTKFFIHHTGVNAFRFAAGHDEDYIEDIIDYLMKQEIVWNRAVEIPKAYIEALWNIDNLEEPDPWEIDHSSKLQVKM